MEIPKSTLRRHSTKDDFKESIYNNQKLGSLNSIEFVSQVQAEAIIARVIITLKDWEDIFIAFGELNICLPSN